MTDFLIVGSGLAGCAFAETARSAGHSMVIIDDGSYNSSRVAAGLYNPVTVKRQRAVPDALYLIAQMNLFYRHVEQLTGTSFMYDMPFYRRFASQEEQNNWFASAADKPLADLVSEEFMPELNDSVPSDYGFGRVRFTGWLDTVVYLNAYKKFLLQTGLYLEQTFNHNDLIIQDDAVVYNGRPFKQIVFCEGFGLSKNPFFNYLPLPGTKGELLEIEAPDLKLECIVNSGLFILPLGGDRYKVGATYVHHEKTPDVTAEGLKELQDKLDTLLTCEYRVVEQRAEVRPTVKDRRPLVGRHPHHDKLYVFNGLGTRGVMYAPALAARLLDFINGSSLPIDINISRYGGLYRPEDQSAQRN
jgi:glycine oxidase